MSDDLAREEGEQLSRAEVASVLSEIAREDQIAAWDDLRSQVGVDLLAVDVTKPIEWLPGAEGITRKRERQAWVAREGEGKTQAAVQFSVQVAEAGGRVLYIDVENDPTEMAERLQPIVASFGEAARVGVRERLSYLPGFNIAAVMDDVSAAALWVKSLLVSDLLVIDSIARVLSMCGYDENSNPEFAKWMGEYIDPIVKNSDTAVIVLENMGYSAADRSRGAVNKRALVETVFNVSGGKDVTPTEHGTLRLKRDRSRSGRVAKYITAGAGGGEYGRLTPQEGEAPKSSAAAKQEARRADVLALFGDEPLNLAAIKKRISATDNTLRGDLVCLEAEGHIHELADDEKPGRGDWWIKDAGELSIPAI